MTSYTTLIYNKIEKFHRITLNRPEVHNAINPTLIQELIKALDEAEKLNTRVVVIDANGRNFCAGADLHWMQASAKYTEPQNHKDAFALATLLNRLANYSLPTIALTQGKIMGGGGGLSACCDFVIASDNAQFCFSEVKLGLVPATIAPFVIRRIGYQATKRLFLTAETIDAKRALDIQLVDAHFPEAQLEKKSDALIEMLLKNGPESMKGVKSLVNSLHPVDASTLENASNLLADVRASEEAQEGLKAFFEKRKPNWNSA